MTTTPDIFDDNELTPDPHGGIYCPRVLGRNGNYINFINDTIWINDTWLMNPDWNGSSSSPFYGHQYYLMDEFGYKASGWVYSIHFGWLYIYNTYRNYTVDNDVGYLWVWFPATIGGSDLGWCAVFRDDMSRNSIYVAATNTTYSCDFLVVRYMSPGYRYYAVRKSGSNIYFRDSTTATEYTYNYSNPSGTVSPPDNPDEETAPDFELPPVVIAGPLAEEGFEHSNVICGGSQNQIIYGRRSTIINGQNLQSGFVPLSQGGGGSHGRYNCHIIGLMGVGVWHLDNRFYVHCAFGLHVIGGDVVADRLSDNRLKNNLKKIKNATNKIKKIRAVSFDWNQKQQIYNGRDIGLIAQDVEKIIPEAVSDRENGFKGVQYHKVIPLLVQSIKEKQDRINILRNKINEFKNGIW